MSFNESGPRSAVQHHSFVKWLEVCKAEDDCNLTDGHVTGPVAQWIRHRPTEPGIASSSPAGVIFPHWNP